MTELALRDDRAILPGSFDPPTRGHFDVIRRAAPLFARLVVAVVENPEKRSLFTAEERVELIERELHDLARVEVVSFRGLTVDLAAHSLTAAAAGQRVTVELPAEWTELTACGYGASN